MQTQYDLLVPRTGTVEDLIQALQKKANLSDEAEAGRIRVYETSSHRFYREPRREHLVSNLNDYTQIYAERVPEEELAADDNNFINVFHFQTEVTRVHGVPFKFLLVEVSGTMLTKKGGADNYPQGEKFVDTKKRLEKRTGLKGKSFEKIKFAVVRRANFSKPQYLNDGTSRQKANRRTMPSMLMDASAQMTNCGT